MTPSSSSSSSVVNMPSLDVVQFSSALTHSTKATDPQWLISPTSREIDLRLPDGHSLTLSVKLKDQNQMQKTDFITIDGWLNRQLIDSNGDRKKSSNHNGHSAADAFPNRILGGLVPKEAFPFSMHCLPPKPRFKSPDEEPDDNSLKMRATRYGFAQIDIDPIQSNWTIQEKCAYVWIQLYVIVSMLPAEEAVNIAIRGGSDITDLVEALIDANLVIPHPTASTDNIVNLIALRSTFWQSAFPFPHVPWLNSLNARHRLASTVHDVPFVPQSSASGIVHPTRPRKPKPQDGPVYTRYILELGQTLTFEPISSADDEFLTVFTRWQNDSRVASGWRQPGSREEQWRYLQSVENDPSKIGLVGKWDGQPWGYVEIYWAKESNIGVHYAADDYDRGFHALVGEQHFRGPHRVRSWMGSLIHAIFTMDIRTKRVVLEPRASNAKMINYASICGGHVEKLIDLGHKRAALIVCPREGFFQLCPLAPLSGMSLYAPPPMTKATQKANAE